MEENSGSTRLILHPLDLSDINQNQCSWPTQVSDDENNGSFSCKDSPIFSVAMGMKRKRNIMQKKNEQNAKPRAMKYQWKVAAHKALYMEDPWKEFHLDELEVETAIRYRYNALCKKWVVDKVNIKMAKEPFNHGAMRSCYRVKKPSHVSSGNWAHASNYVAKRYMEDVDRKIYFEDVKLQMDAKLWSEEYNRHNPPKKVDIFQMYVIELCNRSGKPLYHLEHYIEGNYIKYNSNSGFISREAIRLTPQQSCKTRVRGTEEICILPSQYERSHLTEFLRARTPTFSDSSPPDSPIDAEISDSSRQPRSSESSNRTMSYSSEDMDGKDEEKSEDDSDDCCNLGNSSDSCMGSLRRNRYDSESSATSVDEHDRIAFQNLLARKSRPSSVLNEVQLRKLMENTDNIKSETSVLGQVHLEMAKYYELGRFLAEDEEDYDHDAALFHMQHAADCGIMEAVIIMARLHLHLQHDLLVGISVTENQEKGVEFMLKAAKGGDRAAIIFMAKAYDTGENLGLVRSRSWKEAVYWYDRAVNMEETDAGGEFDACMDDPTYQLLSRQADLYRQGGFGLEKDPNRAGELYQEAADAAMAAMKGRLANKFYMLAEEAWGELEE
ncbi:eukaryotic elongation factor 2 kinase-like isoform X3 [Limulus polyphemus]|uniref:Eukaryotic elongation factor 2 kinase-like isoform X3 n=1 Tax=Limulus polyphemus TaxID=6850 RepID=A0ABM1RV81_LIMPO|nr:eukaryotic elongation factor 2 kinase-like isoform X3 [Limulus polyphemus]